MQDVPKTRESVPARHIAAVVVGNALEFYDFLTYSFFAVYIGRAFFPSSDPSASLLASLATFGAGFVTRPIGALVIGRMGDRLGRKPAMILSFWLMGVAITGLALTPPHAMIGVAAPALVIFFRMLQGFALGGEVGPTTAFLLEVAPPERRGFYTAFQYWTQDLAVLISGLVGFGLTNMLSEQQLQDFGWRIAFLAGAAIVPFGLAMRRRLPETVVVGLCGVVFDLVSGALSDRIGRKRMMLIPGVLLLVSILPAFYVISHYRTTAKLLGATAVLSSLLSLSAVPMLVWITESLPAAIRSGSVAVIYAVSISTFGGTTQYAITWLMKATGNPLAPAWYWTAALVVGIAAMCATRESAPRKTKLNHWSTGALEVR